MSNQPNHFTIVGNIGKELVLNKTANQISVCNIRLCNTRQWNQKQPNNTVVAMELPTWVDIVAWGGLAETCVKYLTKGREITVFGRLEAKPEWVDVHGQKRNDLQLVATDIHFGPNPQKYIEQGYQMGLAANAQGIPPGTTAPTTVIQPGTAEIKTGHPSARPVNNPAAGPVVFMGDGTPSPEDVGGVIVGEPSPGQQLFITGV